MPEPVDDAQRLTLQAIWDLLARDGRWPTFHELDQRLYREHELDAARLLPQLPPGLLYGVGHGSNMSIAASTTIGLTIAGVAATGRAQREVGLFLAVVRHAVVLERDYDPPADQPDLRPVLTAAEVAALLGLTLPQDVPLLNRLGAILYTERWGSTGFGGIGSDVWQASIGREVRQFRHVDGLDGYWQLRPKHWEPELGLAEPGQAPAAATTPAPSGVPESAIVAGHAAGRDNRTGVADRSRGSVHHVDVLVVAALPEELAAAREAALASNPDGPGVARWEQRNLDGSPYLWGEYRIEGAIRFTVALARPTHMGGRTTGTFAAMIADRLSPAALAMCGVCAGSPEETALGDVVVGEPVYEWDEGKHSPSGFHGDHRQIPMNGRWLRAAQEFDSTGLSSYGDATEDEALLWFLEQLYRGQQPRSHPALKHYFPSGTWQPRLARLEAEGWIVRESNGTSALTPAGSDRVQQRLYDDVDGPQRLPFRVLAAPMASGSAVISDPSQWGELKAMGVRKIAAIEMEAATIATIAQARGLPWVVAKGVMDHADTKKDDRYKQFAARASAQVMFALLAQLMSGEDAGARYVSGPAEQRSAPAALGRAADSRVQVSEPAPADIASWLDNLAASDPIPDAADRVNGRLYLVVHPAGTAADALAEISTTSAAGELNAAIHRAVAARGGPPFSPDLGHGVWRRRSSGMVSENGVSEDGSVREDSLLAVRIAENGEISLLCGRATSMARPVWRPVGPSAEPGMQRVILPGLVLGLVHGALRLAADLAERYAGYDGPWGIGLRLTGIRDAIAYEYVQSGDEDVVQPYDADNYQKTVTAHTSDLRATPEAVTEQLVGALLRGLSVDKLYPRR